MARRFLPDVKQLSSYLEDASLILSGVIQGEVYVVVPVLEIPLYGGTDANEDLKSRMFRCKLTRSTCKNWKEMENLTTKDDDYKAFWRTIIADRLLDGSGPPGLEYGEAYVYGVMQRERSGDLDGVHLQDFNIS
ncbi:MAG: hypothetical protein Q9201_000203 [Fulgogasparrea decipioides]